MFGGVFFGKRVLVTGHTGFKGAWICEWLLSLGAKVTGFALQPATNPSLFIQLDLANRIEHVVGDIRSIKDLKQVILDTQPDFVFHLAAQPLVRRSYSEGVYTWETNVLGTIHVLEALRLINTPCVAVMVTTDKCYKNNEWFFGYREIDALGGHDPYSSSKAAAELAIASWRDSFYSTGHPVQIASARAGNVIGGGDWAEDRIVPDAVRALQSKKSICIRNPSATRPWQHVLEPSSGYLALAAAMAAQPGDRRLTSAFNIGPNNDANQTVRCLVEMALKHWPGKWISDQNGEPTHEASLLQLDSNKIRAILGWQPTWSFTEAVERTVMWYRDVLDEKVSDVATRTRSDIRAFETDAVERGIAWTNSIQD